MRNKNGLKLSPFRARMNTAAGIFILAFLAVCIYNSFCFFAIRYREVTVGDIERLSPLRLRERARVVEGASASGIDVNLIALVEMPADCGDELIDMLKSQGFVVSRANRFGITNDARSLFKGRRFDWWRPDSARQFVAGRWSKADTTAHVLIPLDGPDADRMYIYIGTW